MFNATLLLLAAVVLCAESQTFSVVGQISESQSVTLRCTTTDFSDTIFFELNTANKGGCLAGAGGLCQTSIAVYQNPTRQGTTVTEMIIPSFTQSRDGGSWTCTYGTSRSASVTVQSSSPASGNSDSGLSEDKKIIVISVVVPGGTLLLAALTLVLLCKFNVLKARNSGCERRPSDSEFGPFKVKAHEGENVTLLEEQLQNVEHIKQVTWYFGEQALPKIIGRYQYEAALIISKLTLLDTGRYKCEIILENKSKKCYHVWLEVTVATQTNMFLETEEKSKTN